MARRYLGYGTTNSQGIATLDHDPDGNTITGYTGVGAGMVDIIATSGSLQSETFEIIDALFVDDGTTDKNWSYKNNMTKSSDGTEVTLTQTSTSSDATMRLDGLNGDYCFEFDVKYNQIGGFSVSFRKDSSSKGAVYATTMGSENTYHHVKLSVIGSRVNINVDGEDKTPLTLSDTWNRFYFNLTNGATVNYKNFCYYLI